LRRRDEQPRTACATASRGARLHQAIWRDAAGLVQGFGEVTEAIYLEKRLKRWRREWKIQLIEEENPIWDDLYQLLIAENGAHDLVRMGPG
jgi:putative endonuclease